MLAIFVEYAYLIVREVLKKDGLHLSLSYKNCNNE